MATMVYHTRRSPLGPGDRITTQLPKNGPAQVTPLSSARVASESIDA
jgi:hypothetical protein